MDNLNLNDTQEFTITANLTFDASGLTDIGVVRDNNEDQFLIVELEKRANLIGSSFQVDEDKGVFNGTRGMILAVADGVGGGPAGERASQLAVEEIYRHLNANMPWFLRLHNEHEDELMDALKDTVRRCELAVEYEGDLIPDEQGMSTTLTMAYVIWPRLYVVHVGDSRCYIVRNSELLQVTRDHTYAQALLEAGHLKKHEVKTSKFSHVILNSIGRGVSELHAEVYKSNLQEGDQVLLCTDGLTDMLEGEQIAAIIRDADSSEQACKELVEAAKHAGGRDNITIAICEPLVQKKFN